MSNHSISRCLRCCVPLALIAAAAACSPARRSAGPPPAVLFFTNESLSQANVYLVSPGVGARRIGTVMAGRTERLLVPAHLTTGGNLNIVARLLARSGAPQTGVVWLRPGERYQIRLPANAKLLSFLPGEP
jgi:hypothetical protein